MRQHVRFTLLVIIFGIAGFACVEPAADTGCENPLMQAENCAVCKDDRKTGPDCTECIDPKFTGEQCNICADEIFSGPACDQCTNSRFAAPECTECADPFYGGENCDEPRTLYVDDLRDGKTGTGSEEDPFRDLQAAIDAVPDGATLNLAPGTYIASAETYDDPGCGNCDDTTYANGAKATRGFLVEGKSIHLVGASKDETILETRAGYGLLFTDAGTSSVKSLKITGGIRDADSNATDAGIVVRFTTLTVEDVSVSENDDLYEGPEPDPVVGVGGIFGREGSDITVLNSIVENNSWDGIALYRGVPGQPETAPRAYVEGTRIGCTIFCTNPRGRGVGLAATWDAQLTAVGNSIHHYWKGLGSFGKSRVQAYNNIIRHQIGWGVIASGESEMHAHNNVIVYNGTTGLASWNLGVSGSFLNNIIYGNGTSADEWVGKKTGVWLNADPFLFEFSYNLVWDNADFNVCTGGIPNDPANPCEEIDFAGKDGNISEDPGFVSSSDFHLQSDSPAVDTGDPDLEDDDGTRSDMGVYGGLEAPESLP